METKIVQIECGRSKGETGICHYKLRFQNTPYLRGWGAKVMIEHLKRHLMGQPPSGIEVRLEATDEQNAF